MDIIQFFIDTIQSLNQQVAWLLAFICRYIPLKQWAYDDSHSPKYQKYSVDEPPVIVPFIKQDWEFLIKYYEWRYKKPFKPVKRRNGRSIPEDTVCPVCGAPHTYLYDNTGGRGEYETGVNTLPSDAVDISQFRAELFDNPSIGDDLKKVINQWHR